MIAGSQRAQAGGSAWKRPLSRGISVFEHLQSLLETLPSELMAVRGILPALICGMSLAGGAAHGGESTPALTTSAEVLALSAEEADRHRPVMIEGIVTFSDSSTDRAYLQDATGGTLFHPGLAGQPDDNKLLPGDRVEITGVTFAGNGSPQIAGGPISAEGRFPAVRLRRLGHGQLPEPMVVSAEQIQSGAVQNQYVSLRATIRSLQIEDAAGGASLSMLLSGPRGLDGWRMAASLLTTDAPDPALWENFAAEVRGVAIGTGENSKNQRRPQLLIPSVKQVRPDHDLIRRAFEQAPRSIGDIFHHQRIGPGGETPYTRVQGSVTLSRPGEGIYLGETDLGLWVQTPQATATRCGDQVDVIGLPGRDQRGGYLKDAIFRVIGHQALPAAPKLDPTQAMKAEHHAARVALEGELVGDIREAGFRWVLLENEGRRIHARILSIQAEPGTTNWQAGSWLRVTGVSEAPPSVEEGGPPRFLTILVESANDVAVVRPAPWFTPDRVRLLLGTLVAAIALASLWVILLHRQVARQTCVISEQAKQKTLVEERQRMARELHDTLEQQLVGIQVRIDSAIYWLPEAPFNVREALREARGMLDHSRAEARRSIFELRSPVLEGLSLPDAVRSSARQFAESGVPRIEVVTTGNVVRLPRATEFHILRIVQEAITNALKHAAAREIHVSFAYADSFLRVAMRDDGHGFDPDQKTSDEPYHFGLMGMRERVVRIKGRFDLTSSPDGGTTIVIEVPTNSKS